MFEDVRVVDPPPGHGGSMNTVRLGGLTLRADKGEIGTSEARTKWQIGAPAGGSAGTPDPPYWYDVLIPTPVLPAPPMSEREGLSSVEHDGQDIRVQVATPEPREINAPRRSQMG